MKFCVLIFVICFMALPSFGQTEIASITSECQFSGTVTNMQTERVDGLSPYSALVNFVVGYDESEPSKVGVGSKVTLSKIYQELPQTGVMALFLEEFSILSEQSDSGVILYRGNFSAEEGQLVPNKDGIYEVSGQVTCENI